MSRKRTTKHRIEVVVPGNNTLPGLATDWLCMIMSKVRGLRFGSIGITIHDGREVQIETNTKVRFDKAC
jgi:hypothetical protein